MLEHKAHCRFDVLLHQIKEEYDMVASALVKEALTNTEVCSKKRGPCANGEHATIVHVESASISPGAMQPSFCSLDGQEAASTSAPASWLQCRPPSQQLEAPGSKDQSDLPTWPFWMPGTELDKLDDSPSTTKLDMDDPFGDLSHGFQKSQMTTKPHLWKMQTSLTTPEAKSDVITNFRLKKAHSMRERAQIRLGMIGHRAAARRERVVVRRAFSHFKTVLGFTQHNPLMALESFMSVVIVLNAICIGISCDTSKWRGWFAIDTFFACSFSLESALKIYFFGCRDFFRGELRFWHWLEVILIVLSFVEIVGTYTDVGGLGNLSDPSFLRLLRLLRLTKILRVCRLAACKDLVMMIDGTVGGLRTFFWAIIIISTPIYMVALVLRESLGQESTTSETGITGSSHFSTLGRSFFTVFRCIVATDCSDELGRPIFVLVSKNYQWVYTGIYCITFVFMTLGLSNVIVAIYVERTVAASKYNDMRRKEERLRDQDLVREKCLELAMLAYCLKHNIDMQEFTVKDVNLDEVYAMEIKQGEFVSISENFGFCEILDELDIAREDHPVLFDTLDSDRGGTIDIHELIAGVSKLRGDIRKSDIIAVMLGVRQVGRIQRNLKKEIKAMRLELKSALMALQQEGRFGDVRL